MLPAYAAAELVHQAVTAAASQSLAQTIGSRAFNTVIGPIAFDRGHELKDNPFRLLEWRGSTFNLSRPATE
jgi:branched-chain amino acid transport system substrate-binding protein